MTRDALLAEVGRALRTVMPESAESLMQELEYATGRDPRPISFTVVSDGRPIETGVLPGLLAAANRIEGALPSGRRVTWSASVTPIHDTTIFTLGIGAEPVSKRTRAVVFAHWFFAAFEPEMTRLRESDAQEPLPTSMERRIRFLGMDDPDAEAFLAYLLAPQTAVSLHPRFGILPLIEPALLECFPDRADELVDRVWEALARPWPSAKAARHDGGTPGRTPRELALQVVDLMNAVEAEQPEGLRVSWSAAPAPAGAIELRATQG